MPILIVATTGVLAFWFSRVPINKVDVVLLLGWFIVGYVFFYLIDLKETRHSTLLLPPLLISAGLAAARLSSERLASGLAMALVIGTGVYTWRYEPVPAVDDYREAANWIASNTPDKSVVMFSGSRDGLFIFNMRCHEDRRDIYLIRADKLLLDISVRRELGVEQKTYSTEQIGEMLSRYGVDYVVAQTDFWTDLEIMARLQEVLPSNQFEQVHQIAINTNLTVKDKELRIYRNTHPIATERSELQLNLPIIGRKLEGSIGGEP